MRYGIKDGLVLEGLGPLAFILVQLSCNCQLSDFNNGVITDNILLQHREQLCF